MHIWNELLKYVAVEYDKTCKTIKTYKYKHAQLNVWPYFLLFAIKIDGAAYISFIHTFRVPN